MNIEGFRNFLVKDYIGTRDNNKLSKKAISDLLSRCLRIERELKVNLDDLITHKTDFVTIKQYIHDNSDMFNYKGSKKYFYNQFASTAKIYHLFKKALKQ